MHQLNDNSRVQCFGHAGGADGGNDTPLGALGGAEDTGTVEKMHRLEVLVFELSRRLNDVFAPLYDVVQH